MANSHLSIGLAFVGGLLNALSPCVLPILPVFVGRSFQSHVYGPIALVGGLITGFAVAGSLLGVTAIWFIGLANILHYGAIALLLFLGLLAIFPNWNYQIFSYIPISNWTKKSEQVGLIGEFWIGTQLGLLWTPCAGPVLGAILVLAAVKHEIISAFGLLLVYGLGAGLPLLGIAYGGRSVTQQMLKLRSHSSILQRVGGVIIVATAITILLGWDVQIQLWLAPFFPRLPL